MVSSKKQNKQKGGNSYASELIANMLKKERGPAKVATIIAVAFHILVLWVVVPDIESDTIPGNENNSPVIRSFRLPDPPPPRQTTRRPARTVPMPDPTPDAPEPTREPMDLSAFQDSYAPEYRFDVDVPDAAPARELGRPGGNISEPVILKRVKPSYNQVGREAGIEGTVILDCLIGADGRVHDVKVIRSLRFLDEEAIRAVRQWEFRPALLNGQPVDVYFVLTVHFRLER